MVYVVTASMRLRLAFLLCRQVLKSPLVRLLPVSDVEKNKDKIRHTKEKNT